MFADCAEARRIDSDLAIIRYRKKGCEKILKKFFCTPLFLKRHRKYIVKA